MELLRDLHLIPEHDLVEHTPEMDCPCGTESITWTGAIHVVLHTYLLGDIHPDQPQGIYRRVNGGDKLALPPAGL